MSNGDAFSHLDPLTKTRLRGQTYPYGGGAPEHGWQITAMRGDLVAAVVRLPREQAVLLALAILDSYQERPTTQPANRRYLSPGQVARMLEVDPKTVTRWARKGQIDCITTPGGHRRFRAEDIEAMDKRRRAAP